MPWLVEFFLELTYGRPLLAFRFNLVRISFDEGSLHLNRALLFLSFFLTISRVSDDALSCGSNILTAFFFSHFLQCYHDTSQVTDELVQIILNPGLQPGAADIFLEFICYSGGPLPEELLPRVKVAFL